jgi:predicted aspartyl protease
MKYKLLGAVLLCGSLPLAANAQQNASAQSWEVPFTLYRNFMIVVQGSIGDLDRLNFLVDTGTNPSVIDKRITKKLHVNGYKGKLPVVSGEMATSEVLIPSVNIGPVSQTAVRMAVEDLNMLEHDLGIRIDAMVGLDVLSCRNFRIDYEARSITFGPINSSAEQGAAFQSEPPFVTVEMRMNQQPVHLLVDTGSPELVLFESHIASPLRALAGTIRSLRNLNGILPLREVQLSDTQLGNSSFGAKRAYVASDHNNNLTFDGLLGVSALHVRQVSFDFERRLFSWQSGGTWIPTMSGEGAGNCSPTETRAAMAQSLLRLNPGCAGTHPRPRSAQ